MITINVNEIAIYAMFEQDGTKLREAIIEALKKDEVVQLDFKGVDYFTTMFFNASIGWLVLEEGPLYVENKVKVINLSELGKMTWQHSFENAKKIRDDKSYKEAIRCYDENTGE